MSPEEREDAQVKATGAWKLTAVHQMSPQDTQGLLACTSLCYAVVTRHGTSSTRLYGAKVYLLNHHCEWSLYSETV